MEKDMTLKKGDRVVFADHNVSAFGVVTYSSSCEIKIRYILGDSVTNILHSDVEYTFISPDEFKVWKKI